MRPNRFATALLLSILASGTVSAQTLEAQKAPANPEDALKVIYGGGDQKSSVYSNAYVPHTIKKLEESRLPGYRWGGITDGTLDNAERVTRNPTHLAVGQRDILMQLRGQTIPGSAEKYAFTVLHEDIGPECLYMVTAQKNFQTLGHVLGNSWDLTVHTGGIKSGSFGTWRILQSVFEELKDVPVNHAGNATNIVAAVKKDPSSFGFFVMRPDPSSDTFKEINNAGLALIPVIDSRLEGTYRFLDLKVAHGGFLAGAAKSHTTACTSVSLITGDPSLIKQSDTRTLRRLQATIERIKALPSETLRPDLAGWKDMWDSMKETSGEKARQLMAEAQRALREATKKQ